MNVLYWLNSRIHSINSIIGTIIIFFWKASTSNSSEIDSVWIIFLKTVKLANTYCQICNRQLLNIRSKGEIAQVMMSNFSFCNNVFNMIHWLSLFLSKCGNWVKCCWFQNIQIISLTNNVGQTQIICSKVLKRAEKT